MNTSLEATPDPSLPLLLADARALEIGRGLTVVRRPRYS